MFAACCYPNGAIAGGDFGGFAGFVLTLAAVWFLLYMKKEANKTTRYEMGQSEAHTALTAVTQSPQGVLGSLTVDYGIQELQAGEVSKAAGRPEFDAVYMVLTLELYFAFSTPQPRCAACSHVPFKSFNAASLLSHKTRRSSRCSRWPH